MPISPPILAGRPSPIVVVLDTNIVLDWLVFRDPRCEMLRRGLVARRLRWIATAEMREELAHVLSRNGFAAWQPDLPQVWAHWDEHAIRAAPPAFAPGATCPFPLCTDPDDQKFINLAIAVGARWLFSRDRAVLKLGRRLRAYGVEATTPESCRFAAAAQ